MSTKIKENGTITVSSKVFAQNMAHYFNLAGKENVSIKRGKRVFQLVLREDNDVALYDQAKANDDGYRVSAKDLRAKYGV